MKVTLVLLIALTACALLRRRSASLRHWVLASAVVAAIAVPVAERLLPPWSVTSTVPNLFRASEDPRAQQLERTGSRASADPRSEGRRGRGSEDPPLHERRSLDPRLASVLPWLWLAGTAASLLILLAGFIRLRRIALHAQIIRTGAWVDACAAIGREYGLTRPIALLRGADAGVLVTWGVLRPKILLPPSAETWTEARIRVVLRHELAHVARRDWLSQLAAEILRCVYWFNPLTWIVSRRLRQESERAADDAVLLRGVRPAEYAEHLLDIARLMTHRRRAWAAAPAVARASSLERRISAMLNHQLDRQPISRVARVTTGVPVVAVTALIASLVLAQEAPARFTGAVTDPSGAPLPDVTISLTHRASGVTHAAPTDQAGAFSFTTLPGGEYLLETRALGFAALEQTLTLAPGGSTHRDFRLNIGSIEETITVGEPLPGPPPARREVDVAGLLERFRGQRLQPPIKVTHTAPTYPAALREAGIEGQVILRGRVAADGTVTGIEVSAPAHPDLIDAAADAARQWRFEPTRLWGTPVEVPIRMTFNFRAPK